MQRQALMPGFMAAAALVSAAFLSPCTAKLVNPAYPPRGWNSFDLEFDRRYNTSIPVWNETAFRQAATAMANQLLPHGYDLIVIDGGWSSSTDGYGRAVPNTTMWPSAAVPGGGPPSFKPLADFAHNLGLRFGVWTLRGVAPSAVEKQLPVYGASPPTTIDKIAYGPNGTACPEGPESVWCTCSWDPNGVGLDASKPGTRAYYDSVVSLYAEWGVDLIKWDCMYEGSAGYSAEVKVASAAISASDREMVLSLSPGGDMTTSNVSMIEQQPWATMLRVTGDFHSQMNMPWVVGIPRHLFVVGNLSATAAGGADDLLGVNGCYPDLDIVDLGKYSDFYNTPEAELHATMWMMARSPLMYGGPLPIEDAYTLDLVTNPVALRINNESRGLQVRYTGNCTCRVRGGVGHACKPLADNCGAVWWSKLGQQCTALAVLNVGMVPKDTTVNLADIVNPTTMDASALSVTYVYEHKTVPAGGTTITVHTEALGGKLMVVAPQGLDPMQC
eukprot:m.189068 g.189068  ORF g.189068 m.189068 type:complete len:501 (-) comp17627_c0_seq1:3654-5156(-)